MCRLVVAPTTEIYAVPWLLYSNSKSGIHSFIWASTSKEWQTWYQSHHWCHCFSLPLFHCRKLGPPCTVLAQCCSRPFCRPQWFFRRGRRSPLSPRVQFAGFQSSCISQTQPSLKNASSVLALITSKLKAAPTPIPGIQPWQWLFFRLLFDRFSFYFTVSFLDDIKFESFFSFLFFRPLSVPSSWGSFG